MRMCSSRRLILFCGLMSIVLLASTAMAQQRARRSNNPGGYAEGRLMKRNVKEIGLSEEIVAKIDAVIKAGFAVARNGVVILFFLWFFSHAVLGVKACQNKAGKYNLVDSCYHSFFRGIRNKI